MVKIGRVLAVLDQLFPPTLADRGDPVGLQVGDPEAEAKAVAVALEATLDTIDDAEGKGCTLLVTHHPLIFRPLAKVLGGEPAGAAVTRAIRAGLCVTSCHTNADWAQGGLNDHLAGLLDLKDIRPLEPRARTRYTKLVTFVPPEKIEEVSAAVFRAGAGRIGDYDHCSFRLEGTGTFRPGKDADPYSGEVGEDSLENEIRLECLVPQGALSAVVKSLIEAHPYEEVAYDLYPLTPADGVEGVARVGVLENPATPMELGQRLKETLGASHLRGAGPLETPVENLVICSGAGAFLIPKVARLPATALITGDLKYHDALLAEQWGLPVLDIGHFAGEIIFVDLVVEKLSTALKAASLPLNVLALRVEKDPIQLI